MSNNKKPAEHAAKPKQPMQDRAKAWIMPKIDWTAKMAAAAFFLATAYGYVSTWLKAHQPNEQIPVAGGIMVVSIALYLYARKR